MPSKIRILICDDNEDTREGTSRLLETEDDMEIVDFADNGYSAVNKAVELQPDVILMDINMPGINGIEATQQIKEALPATQIVVVSVQDDANYIRAAIRAGAVDFVPKPISFEDLTQAIRRAYSNRPSISTQELPAGGKAPSAAMAGGGYGQQYGQEFNRAGKVIAIASTKGGVGKTTIAISLAVGLAKTSSEKRVLVVDTNIYSGDVAVFMNTRSQYNIVDTAVMAQEAELDAQGLEGVVVPHDSGIHLLVAPSNPLEAAPLTGAGLQALIGDLKKQYDYVIVDTASVIDEILITVLQEADHTIVITQATMPALKNSRIMFNLLNELVQSIEDPDENMRRKKARTVLLNRYNAKNSRITPDQIGNFLKAPVSIVIPDDPYADVSLNNAAPLITADPRRAESVKALGELVRSIRSMMEDQPAAAPEAVPEGGKGRGTRTTLFGSFLGGS